MNDAPTSTPQDDSRLLRLALLSTGALAIGLLLVRLSSFGIWDPWELSAAEAGRRALEGNLEAAQKPPLSPWLIGGGFGLLSVREWAGRLPIALSGLLALGVLWAWVRRAAGDRVALYATLVASTSLAVILNSRQMLGEAPTLASGAVVGLGAMGALFDEQGGSRRGPAWLALVALGSLFGIMAGGALLGVLPPLLATVVAAALLGELDPRTSPRMRDPWVLALLAWTAVVCAMVALDIWRDTADYSAFVGGVPLGDAPPTFDRSVEVVFHGFAPWSALLPVAIGACLGLADANGRLRADAPLRLAALLWAAFALAAHSLFQSRFGSASYPGTLALATMVALWLFDLERSRRGYWAAGLVTAFFAALIIRDFALYPQSPIDALAVSDPEVPEAFNPKRAWAGVLGAFGATAFAATCARPVDAGSSIKAPYLWVARQWKQGGFGIRAWLTLGGLLLLGCIALGLTALIGGKGAGMSSLMIRVGKGALVVPFALPVLITGTQWLAHLVGRLERFRLLPLWLSAAAVALYAAHGFLPALSGHLSPRDVFEAYNRYAAEGEPLAEHQVGSRAAAYYATGEVQEVESRNALIRYLTADDGRRWATFPSEHLAEVDRGFRKRMGRHLVIASDPDTRVVLAASQPVSGLTDQNPLSKTVVSEAPKIDHPIRIDFEGKVALLGYNLSLPNGDSVGPGQRFTIEWIFEALENNVGSYQVFVHMDGAGNRIHGDHDPVDGAYPVSLWQRGDVIVDRQTLAVPTNFRPGNYQIMVGFYRGNHRLEVVDGPHDGTNRAKVGMLKVR